MKLMQNEDKLKERVKELTCLYEVSKIISQSNGLDLKVLKKIILNVKKAWKYNKDATVEIQIYEHYLTTSKLPEDTIFQISLINIPEKNPGYIKVHYPLNKYKPSQFLDDEQKLLNKIAVEIADSLEKNYTVEKKEALQRTIERMDRLSILGEMTAGIAHELNNPLANILGYAELIKLNNSNPENDEDITIIINSVIYTREIVKKLMFFSREMPYQSKYEVIKPIVTFALSFLKPNFKKKEIKNKLLFQDDNITAKVDSVQLTQILFNLLINALHASPENSTITTSIENDAENLIIRIEDQGSGIPDNIKYKIFEPFFTTKDSHTGYGLGLSVVHGIVKNHNGEIIVQNNYPTGTTFIIKLPL